MRIAAGLTITPVAVLSLATATVCGFDFSPEFRQNIRQRVGAGECPGIIVGVAGPDGPSFLAEGRTSLAPDARPIREDSVFELGSISKTFTALLYQIAVDRGIMKPHDLVGSCLPPDLRLASPVAEITLHSLVTHRSGLPRMPANFKPADPANPYADYSPDRLYAWLRKVEPAKDGKFAYSNAGMGLLGHALERRTRMAYEPLLKSWITAPLALTDTGITLTENQRARMAVPHRDDRASPMWDIPTLAGAGAIRSTARDLLRWSALQAGLIASPLGAAMRRTHQAQAPTGRKGGQVGLGWMLSPAGKDTIVWHNGATGGTRSWAGFNLARQAAVIVLTNSSVPADDIGFHLLGGNTPLRTPRSAAAVPAHVLENCAGTYDFGKYKFVVTPEGHHLRVRMGDQPAFAAYPGNEREFFLRATEAALTFELGADGRVKAVILHQNGRDQRAPRISKP